MKTKLILITTLFITSQTISQANLAQFETHVTEKYYNEFNHKTIWIDSDLQVKDVAFDLINHIKKDKILEPKIEELFEISEIERLIEFRNYLSKDKLLVLDKLLTKLYEKYMTYLSKGSIDWNEFLDQLKEIEENRDIKARWSKYEAKKDYAILLKEAISKGDISIALNRVNYNFPYAKDLEKQLDILYELQQKGGYTKVITNKKILKKGDKFPEIQTLKKRLYESKDLQTLECKKKTKNCHLLFDKELFKAVLSFQKRHGLIADGIVGKKTFEALNEPIENKIKLLRLNLERMRWLPRNLGDRYILINIPAYKLKLYEKEKVKLKMDVIVGKKEHPTPIFSHKMSEIVVNPYWKIPQTIVKNEIIPKLVEDSLYLEKQKIRVHENWDENSLEFDVSSVDWSMYLNNNLIGTPKEAPMRFIQTPGGSNPLGKIKFLFPNQYSVYLHDTPEKEYFKLNEKTLSHGCIRLEKPFELFERVVVEKNNNKDNNEYKLNEKIPIHIVYLTAWVENNKLQFREDIYEYDKIQFELLSKSSL